MCIIYRCVCGICVEQLEGYSTSSADSYLRGSNSNASWYLAPQPILTVSVNVLFAYSDL